MDRLPIELLVHIVASLQNFDKKGRLKPRHGLAILSRVNKLFNEIATPLLYLEPQLGSRRSAELWARTYSNKVNPWNVQQAREILKDVVVPRKVTLIPVYQDAEDRRLTQYDAYITPVSLFRYNTILTPFFFRNLTHFVAYEPLIDNEFISALFGPTGSNRTSIIDLAIGISPGDENLLLFLFQAYPYFSWEWDDLVTFMDIFDDRDYAENAWERFVEEGLPDEEMDWIKDKADERAPFCFSVFDQHNLSEPDSFDFLSNVLSFKTPISTSPFVNLKRLSLTICSNAVIALIFLTPLFPHLRRLELDGGFYKIAHFENKVKMLRYSITKRGGKIEPPFTTEDESHALATLLKSCSWNPLSEKEMEEYQWKPYRGPNLDLLDLSYCELYGEMG